MRKWYNTYIKPLSHTTTWLCVTDGQVTHDYYLPQPIQSILSHDHTHRNKDGHITCYRQTDWLKLHCSRRIWLWANFGPLTLVAKNIENVSVLEVMTSMDFQTLPYLYVTISFLLEICFWGPTHPTFSDDVTNYTLFFKSSLTMYKNHLITL